MSVATTALDSCDDPKYKKYEGHNLQEIADDEKLIDTRAGEVILKA